MSEADDGTILLVELTEEQIRLLRVLAQENESVSVCELSLRLGWSAERTCRVTNEIRAIRDRLVRNLGLAVSRGDLDEGQRMMLDTINMLIFAGEHPTTEGLAKVLQWPIERVERVGRELAAKKLLTAPKSLRS